MIRLPLEIGTYVVAVSGGVDSMALLDLLAKQSPVASYQSSDATDNRQLTTDDSGRIRLVVAHFDHGIRDDSAEDRKLVQAAAERYGLPFAYEEGRLGVQASEAAARTARYDFLERVRQKYHANAIITAHHQDDVLETAILNILRGTGRKGLTSLASRPGIIRPLLEMPKTVLRDYALEQSIAWREDTTNTDDRYLRNYIRHHLLTRLNAAARAQLLAIIQSAHTTNQELDRQLFGLLDIQPAAELLDRRLFTQLPHNVAKELLASWFRRHGIQNFNAKTLERVTIAAKIQRPGAIVDVMDGQAVRITKDSLALMRVER